MIWEAYSSGIRRSWGGLYRGGRPLVSVATTLRAGRIELRRRSLAGGKLFRKAETSAQETREILDVTNRPTYYSFRHLCPSSARPTRFSFVRMDARQAGSILRISPHGDHEATMKFAILGLLVVLLIGFFVVVWKAAKDWRWYNIVAVCITMLLAMALLFPTAGVLKSRAAWHQIKEKLGSPGRAGQCRLSDHQVRRS